MDRWMDIRRSSGGIAEVGGGANEGRGFGKEERMRKYRDKSEVFG